MTATISSVPIQTLVEELRRKPASAFDQTEPLRLFLQQTPVEADSLAPYLTWHRQHYTRNLIDRTPLYELMAICWEVGQASSVHIAIRIAGWRFPSAVCRWKIFISCTRIWPVAAPVWSL